MFVSGSLSSEEELSLESLGGGPEPLIFRGLWDWSLSVVFRGLAISPADSMVNSLASPLIARDNPLLPGRPRGLFTMGTPNARGCPALATGVAILGVVNLGGTPEFLGSVFLLTEGFESSTELLDFALSSFSSILSCSFSAYAISRLLRFLGMRMSGSLQFSLLWLGENSGQFSLLSSNSGLTSG